MAYSPSKLIVVGLGAIALSTAAVFATLPREPSRGDKAEKTRRVKIDASVKTLEAQLQRRFHDRDNLTFGMSRVVRRNDRYHQGPVAGIVKSSMFTETRSTANGGYEVKTEFGDFVPPDKLLPRMHAENEAEEGAIRTLLDCQSDLAIYTVGFIDPKKVNLQEVPASGFDSKTGARAKGPAYLSSRSSIAPMARDVVDYARQALQSKGTPKGGQLMDGWRTIAFRVEADDKACINCHNQMIGLQNANSDKGFRMGDTLGVIVLALRDAKPALQK